MTEWRLLVMRPIVLLVWMNTVASTLLFGLAAYWAIYYPASSVQWVVWLLPTAGFLSLVAFVGNWVLGGPSSRLGKGDQSVNHDDSVRAYKAPRRHETPSVRI